MEPRLAAILGYGVKKQPAIPQPATPNAPSVITEDSTEAVTRIATDAATELATSPKVERILSQAGFTCSHDRLNSASLQHPSRARQMLRQSQ